VSEPEADPTIQPIRHACATMSREEQTNRKQDNEEVMNESWK
jgi:hypothetical protein